MKRKNDATNPLGYWWNEFLFARTFDYESDLDLADLEVAIDSVAHKRDGMWWGRYTEVTLKPHPNNKGFDFDVNCKRRRMADIIGITTARSQGAAYVDSATGKVNVQGTVKFGRVFHIFLVIFLLFAFGFIVPTIYCL